MNRFQELVDYLVYGHHCPHHLLLVISIVVVAIKSMQQRRMFFLFWYALCILLFEAVISKVELFYVGNTFLTTNIFAHTTIVIQMLIYRKGARKRLFYFILVVWLAFCFYSFFWENAKAEVLSSYFAGVILNSILIVSYMNNILRQDVAVDIWKDYRFVLGFGILLFFTSAFPILAFSDELLTLNELRWAYYRLLYYGNVVLVLMILVSSFILWKNN